MNEVSVRSLFEQLTELPAAERAPFLDRECGGDAELRQELQDLLAADEDAGRDTFWQHSAVHHDVFAPDRTVAAAGDVIGNFRLLELIGKGGMGAVYRAERIDDEYSQCVAVKLIDAFFLSPDVIAHFRAERQILASLEHPNITRLLDGGTRADGLPYLVMEYVEGIPPHEYCRLHQLSVTERLTLFRQICSAVHFAHQHMVIHRDLKPANILVTPEGKPKLLDFGIAKVLHVDPVRAAEALTEPGMLKLTARYASPEQICGGPVTTASDVYSLGVILYELLCDHSPYGDEDRPTHLILHAVCEEEPSRPSTWSPKMKGDLDNIVLRALRKAPQERYASVDQFSEDILRHLEGRPVLARGEAPLYVAAKFVRRNRVPVVAAAIVLCSLVVGLVEVSLARARADRRFNDVRRLAHSVMFDYADAIDRLPGATPVRARLVQDALGYLDSLSQEADTPQLQREIVDAYVHVSNVQGNEYENNLGDTVAAQASADKAVAAAEKLLRKDRSPVALSSAASAFSTDGSLFYSAGHLQPAAVAYQRALGLYQDVAKATPQDLDNQIALSTCLRHMGDLYGGYGFTSLGKPAEGLAYLAQAKALDAPLLARFPGNRDVLKESYKLLISLSSAELASGQHDVAAADLGTALAQIQTVSELDPQDVNTRIERAVGESHLGQMLLDNRDAEGARTHLERSAALLQALLQADPSNTLYRRGLSVVEGAWAAALRGVGQIAEGLAHNQTALAMATALSKDAPGSAQYRTDVGVSERKLAEGLLAAGRPADALHHAELAADVLCPQTAGAPDANRMANCGRAKLAAGNADRALHHSDAAVQVLGQAEKIAAAQPQANGTNAIYQSDWARAQAALAGAYADNGDLPRARFAYEAALTQWAGLRKTNALTAEDAQRAGAAEQSLKALPPQR